MKYLFLYSYLIEFIFIHPLYFSEIKIRVGTTGREDDDIGQDRKLPQIFWSETGHSLHKESSHWHKIEMEKITQTD